MSGICCIVYTIGDSQSIKLKNKYFIADLLFAVITIPFIMK